MEFKVKINGVTLFAFFFQLSMMSSFFFYIQKQGRIWTKQLEHISQEMATLRQEVCLLRQTEPSSGVIYLKESAPQGDGLFSFWHILLLCRVGYILVCTLP